MNTTRIKTEKNESVAPEAIFYHALNTALDNNYQKLLKKIEKHGSWQHAWDVTCAKSVHKLDPWSEWQKISNSDINLIMRDSKDFPDKLRHIPNPPHALYIKGRIPKPQPAIGIVGTRKATPSGKELAMTFGKELAIAGCQVMSGLAFGIDAASHRGTLESGGTAIAVMPGGLGSIYPRSNTTLAKKILLGGGCLVSEFSPGATIYPSNFLQRNRIISGLSDAILIIEAPKRSGSLNTARFALEQDRGIFVVPGPAGHPNYAGSHRLIRQGAVLAEHPTDILEDLELLSPLNKEKSSITTEKQSTRNNTDLINNPIFIAIKNADRPLDVDDISATTSLSPTEINRQLTSLMIKGAIRDTGYGYVVTY